MFVLVLLLLFVINIVMCYLEIVDDSEDGLDILEPQPKDIILYIIKPQKGYGFAAILNPGWVDGESGMNENGITVSQNNINISSISNKKQETKRTIKYSQLWYRY